MCEEYALQGNHHGLLRVIWQIKNSRANGKGMREGDRAENRRAEIEREIRTA